jgi:NADH-quinone oxidoreductase subunit I
MEQPPHPMRLGDTDKDYYVGALTNPGTSAGAERAPWATNDAADGTGEATKEAVR